MIRCAVSKGSSSTRLLAASCRAHSSPATPLSPEDLDREFGISDSNYTSPTIDLDAGKGHGWAAVNEVSHVAEQPAATIIPVQRRELPISPYMDPEAIAAKEKYRATKLKPRPNHELTQFQNRIAKNPYARALASPIRYCRVTNVALPRFFLQDFNLVVHPETKEPWWVPRGLARKYPLPWGKEDAKDKEPTTQGEGVEEKELRAGKGPGESESEAHYIKMDESSSTIGSSPKGLPSSTRSAGPKSYVLARQRALAGLPKGRPLAKLRILESSFPIRVRDRGPIQQVFEDAKIRPDIDTFVLELLRRRATEHLVYVTKLGAYILKCAGWKEAIDPKTQGSAILWIGGVPAEQSKFDTIVEPPEFATVDVLDEHGKRRIPVHNLEVLLGKYHVQRLKETCDIFKDEFLVIKNRKLTVEIEMKLWQLQGYMAEYRQILDADFAEGDGQPLVTEE
jgi:hypothetical protein